MYINCKEKAQQIKNEITRKIDPNKPPILTIVQVGDNAASNSYIKGKLKDCEEVGIAYNHYKYNDDIPESVLVKNIKTLQESCGGIIVQLPLPKHINENNIINAIDKEKDVDGFKVDSPFTPCTPLGIMTVLEDITDLNGKDVLIINRSSIVGRPLVNLLLNKDATVTIAHSKTNNLIDKIKTHDIIITAVGIPNFIKKEHLHKGQIVIDVAINRDENGKLCGDVEKGCEEVADVTPVPNGIGLMTRVSLLKNTCKTISLYRNSVDKIAEQIKEVGEL